MDGVPNSIRSLYDGLKLVHYYPATLYTAHRVAVTVVKPIPAHSPVGLGLDYSHCSSDEIQILLGNSLLIHGPGLQFDCSTSTDRDEQARGVIRFKFPLTPSDVIQLLVPPSKAETQRLWQKVLMERWGLS